ncbi:MAG: HAMP domain-containing protein [Paracoccaceae bacterium]|jgi:HAMP domain-containing protein
MCSPRPARLCRTLCRQRNSRVRLTTGQRLTAGIAAAVLVISVLGLAVQYAVVKRDLQARQQQLVLADMAGFDALYDQRRVIAVRQAIECRKLADPGGDLLLTLMDRAGRVLAETGGDWTGAIAQLPEGLQTALIPFTYDGQAYLGVACTLAGGFPLWVARSSAGMDQTLANLRGVFAAVVLGIALVALIVGHFTSRWFLTRITRINRLADQVARGDLAARLPGDRSAMNLACWRRIFTPCWTGSRRCTAPPTI